MEEVQEKGDTASRLYLMGAVYDGLSASILRSSDSLLPGLIDDVALNCLAWVCRSDYPSLSCINTKFNKVIKTGGLYEMRKQMDVVEPWAYLVCDPRGWEAFVPNKKKWITLPRIPCDECVNHADRESLAVGSELLIFGRELLDLAIWKYSLVNRSWVKCCGMNQGRCLFAGGIELCHVGT